jgi:peptidoglycan biosynthesis protein MviN/MurJ (putative lipid II flippase)
VLAFPIARAIAFGALRTADGIELVAVSLAALGLGVLAETWFVLGTYAFYAVEDVRSPVRSMLVRASTALPLMLASLFVDGAAVLVVLGVGMTIGTSAGAIHAWRSLSRRYGVHPPVRRMLGNLVAACAMALPAVATAWWLGWSLPSTHLGDIVGVAAAGAVGLATYIAIQLARRSPELAALRAFRTRGVRGRLDGESA